MTFTYKIAPTIALAATAGLLLAGCTGGGSGGEGGSKNTDLSYGGLSASVAKSLSSYAIVDSGNAAAGTPVPVDAHFAGVDGAASLNSAMEKAIMAALKSGGALGKHKGFDPVLTKPAKRWDAKKFLEPAKQAATAGASGSAAADDETTGGGKGVEVRTRVLAAGGNVIITQLSGTAKGKPVQKTFVTDVSADTTKPASALFSDSGAFDDASQAVLGVNDKALPTVGGNEVGTDKLSDFGKQVHEQLGAGAFKAPTDKKPWLPDFSCGLLPCVGVTYDDGPGDKALTNELIAALKKNNVRGTFYMIGQNVATYPKEAKQLYDMGNEIENHSWNHPQLSAMSAAAVKSQLDRTNKAIEKAGIPKPTQMRPPYGASSASVVKISGMRVMLWDVDTLDWKTKSEQKTIDSAVNTSYPGSMFLMHSIHKWTVDGADATFKGLKARGMYPVPSGYLFKGLPFKKKASYFCRGYRQATCSNPEHPAVVRNS